jgi:hypothetical protein
MELIRITRPAPHAVTANLASSPIPKTRRNNGNKAVVGIPLKNSTVNSSALYILLEYPIKRPSGTPIRVAKPKPTRTRYKVCAISVNIVPV